MTIEGLLVIQQRNFTPDEIRRIGSSLYWRFKMNAMLVRERLAGDGYALLHQGETDFLTAVAEILRQHGTPSWVAPLPLPDYEIKRVHELAAFKDHVTFRHTDGKIRLNRGGNILAVLTGNTATPAPVDVEGQTDRLACIYRDLITAGPSLAVFIMHPETRTADGLLMAPPSAVSAGSDEDRKRYGTSLHRLIGHIARMGNPFSLVPVGGMRGKDLVPGTPAGKGAKAHSHSFKDISPQSLLATLHFQRLLPALCMKTAPWLAKPLEEVPSLKETPSPKVPGMAGAVVVTAPVVAGALVAEGDPKQPEADPVSSTVAGLPPPPPITTVRFGWRVARTQLLILGGAIVFFAAMANLAPPETLDALARFGWHYGHERGVLFFIASAVLFVLSFRNLKYKRIMEDTPTSKTRSVAMGIAEIKGNAVRRYNLLSPVTLTPCVYYRVRKHRRNSKDQWRQYAYMDSGEVTFDLEDETGRIVVNPAGATLVGMRKDAYAGGVMMGMQGRVLPIPPNERWEEEMLFEKAPIYVLGCVRPRERPDESPGERLRERLQALKADPGAMMAFDENGDGRIDQDEWEKVRAATEREIIRESLHRENDEGETGPGAVIGKPREWGSPFIIAATRIEEKLTRRYGLLAFASFAGALIAVGWGVLRLLS